MFQNNNQTHIFVLLYFQIFSIILWYCTWSELKVDDHQSDRAVQMGYQHAGYSTCVYKYI